jgi:hypothetical protein
MSEVASLEASRREPGGPPSGGSPAPLPLPKPLIFRGGFDDAFVALVVDERFTRVWNHRTAAWVLRWKLDEVAQPAESPDLFPGVFVVQACDSRLMASLKPDQDLYLFTFRLDRLGRASGPPVRIDELDSRDRSRWMQFLEIS